MFTYSRLVFFKLRPGRAIVQAVSRWFSTAAARVWSCGNCGGQSGAGAGFLQVLRFPLPIFISPIAPQSPSSIIWGLYNRPEGAAVPRDLVLRCVHITRARAGARQACAPLAARKSSSTLLQLLARFRSVRIRIFTRSVYRL
jgi:hypothetical protein